MSIIHWLILSYNVLVAWWWITSNASTFFYWTFSNVWLIVDKKLTNLTLKILQQQYQKVRKRDKGCEIVGAVWVVDAGMQHYFLSYQILAGSPIKQIYHLALCACRLSPSSSLIFIHFNYKAYGFVLKYNWVYFWPGSQCFLPTYFVGKWLVAWIALSVNFDLSSVPCHASYFSIG